MSVMINLKYLDDKNYILKVETELNNIYHEAKSINNSLRDKINSIMEL